MCLFALNLKLLIYNKRNINKEVMVLNLAVSVKGGHCVFNRHKINIVVRISC